MNLRTVLLAVFVAATPVHAADDVFSPTQKSAVEQIVRDYLRAHPEMVLEALREMQVREQMAKEERTRRNLAALSKDLAGDAKAPWAGNPDGDVTVVEFFDYRCSYCKRVFPTIMELVREDGNIRYVFKEFPILGPASVVATKASLAAWRMAPEAYMDFHSAMMASKGNLTEGKIVRLARDHGLDTDTLKKEMESPEVAALIQSNYEVAQKLDIRGTPAFVIGDKLIPGAASMETFKEAIAAARAGRS